MVASAVDFCPGGADQQWSRACSSAGGAVAQGQFRLGECSGQSVRGAAVDRRGDLPAARTAVAGVPGGGGGGGASRNPSAIAPPCTAGRLYDHERLTAADLIVRYP